MARHYFSNQGEMTNVPGDQIVRRGRLLSYALVALISWLFGFVTSNILAIEAHRRSVAALSDTQKITMARSMVELRDSRFGCVGTALSLSVSINENNCTIEQKPRSLATEVTCRFSCESEQGHRRTVSAIFALDANEMFWETENQ